MRIAFVALNALPAIDPSIRGPIGGIETRSWTFARELSNRPDIDVRFVVRHPQQPPKTHYDGVELVPLIDRLYPIWQSVGTKVQRLPKFPWLRVQSCDAALFWQFPLVVLDRIWRGRGKSPTTPDPRLIETAADVYCTFGVQTHSATVIASAHAAGRPAVLMLGSDGDLDPLFTTPGPERDLYGTRADVGQGILESADRIVVQTPQQQELLKQRFGRDSVLIRNPIDVESWDAGRNAELPEPLRDLDRYVLWIGRAETVHKRPQLCLEVAAACPEATFLMVMNPRDAAVEESIRRNAPRNVRIVPQVPFSSMPSLFRRAAVLLNTSQLEGFPNVFLQAALSEVPIASLEVGEEFLTASGAGRVCHGDITALSQAVQQAWKHTSSPALTASRDYVITEHGTVQQADRLLDVFRDVLNSSRGSHQASEGRQSSPGE